MYHQRKYAHRDRQAGGEHGMQLLDYIALSVRDMTPNLTQLELVKALGLDRTTLITQLDWLKQS